MEPGAAGLRSQDPPSNSRNESNQSPLSPSTPAHQGSPAFLPSQAETEQRVKSETPCNLSESMLRSQRPLDLSAQLLAAPQAVPLTPPPPAPSGHPGPRALWAAASLLLPGLFLGLPAQGGAGARLLWVLRSDTLRWGCDFFLKFPFLSYDIYTGFRVFGKSSLSLHTFSISFLISKICVYIPPRLQPQVFD